MADACHLASYVEVYQAQAILDVVFVENLKRLEQFTGCKTELACIAAALFPTSAALAREFDADTYVRTHTKALAYFRDALQLVEFLHHKKYVTAHLLSKQGKLNVTVVLVAVAYDERVIIGVHGNDRMEFGF